MGISPIPYASGSSDSSRVTVTRTFLVEAYAPASSTLDRISEQAQLAEIGASPVSSIRHIRSILVRDDEMCFHLFEAESADALVKAVQSADMTAPRIVEVTLVGSERR